MEGGEGGRVLPVDLIRVFAERVGERKHHPVGGHAEIFEIAERGCGLDEFLGRLDLQRLDDAGDSARRCRMGASHPAKLPACPVSIADRDEGPVIVVREGAAENALIRTRIKCAVRFLVHSCPSLLPGMLAGFLSLACFEGTAQEVLHHARRGERLLRLERAVDATLSFASVVELRADILNGAS